MFKGLKSYEIVFLIIIATIIYISILKKKPYEHLDADSDTYDEDRIILEKNVTTLKEKVDKLIDPKSNRCGPEFNYKRCKGKTQCCSQWGWCGGEIGKQSDWCSDNNHGAHSGNFDGNSNYQKPTTYKVSTNKKCGPLHDKAHCSGTQCCSHSGECGGQISKADEKYCHDNAHGAFDGHYDGNSVVDMIHPLNQTYNVYIPKKSQSYTNNVNYDAPGNDITHLDNATFKDCQTTCDNLNECKSFNFLTANYPDKKGTCWIKNNASNAVFTPDWNLYIKDIDYSTRMAFDAGGNDITHFNNATFDSCKTECNNRPDCKGFNFPLSSYPNKTGTCWLKNNVTNVYSTNNWNLFKKVKQ